MSLHKIIVMMMSIMCLPNPTAIFICTFIFNIQSKSSKIFTFYRNMSLKEV